MPPGTSPYLVAFWVAAFIVLLPVLRLVWNAAVFFVTATTKVKLIDGISTDMAAMKDAKARESTSLEISLSIIEDDINELQEKAGIDKRHFPDRRIGLPDRRRAS